MKRAAALAAVLILLGLALRQAEQIGTLAGLAAKPGPIHAVFLYESGDVGKYPPDQAAIRLDATLREYLAAHCQKESDGGPAYRFIDPDNTAGQPAWAGPLIEAAKKKPLPAYAVQAGSKSKITAGTWAATPAAQLALLQKVGGK